MRSATWPMVLALAEAPRSAASGSVWSPTYPSAKAPWVFDVRTDEYELFSTAAWKDWLESRPYDPTTMRELRDGWRAPRN